MVSGTVISEHSSDPDDFDRDVTETAAMVALDCTEDSCIRIKTEPVTVEYGENMLTTVSSNLKDVPKIKETSELFTSEVFISEVHETSELQISDKTKSSELSISKSLKSGDSKKMLESFVRLHPSADCSSLLNYYQDSNSEDGDIPSGDCQRSQQPKSKESISKCDRGNSSDHILPIKVIKLEPAQHMEVEPGPKIHFKDTKNDETLPKDLSKYGLTAEKYDPELDAGDISKIQAVSIGLNKPLALKCELESTHIAKEESGVFSMPSISNMLFTTGSSDTENCSLSSNNSFLSTSKSKISSLSSVTNDLTISGTEMYPLTSDTNDLPTKPKTSSKSSAINVPTTSCPICGKMFYSLHYIKGHMRIHTGEKPYQCSICSREFTVRQNLTKHQRIHTGEKRYSCPYCGKLFGDSQSMKRHTRIHTGETPYQCGMCAARFRYREMYIQHMKDHSCHVLQCGKGRPRNSMLRTNSQPLETVTAGGVDTESGNICSNGSDNKPDSFNIGLRVPAKREESSELCLNDLVDKEGKSCLNDLVDKEGKSCLNDLVDKEGKSCLNDLVNKEGKSCLNDLVDKEGKSCLNDLVNKEGKSCLNDLVDKEGKSCLNDLVDKDGKSYLNDLVNTEGKSCLNDLVDKEGKSCLNDLVNKEGKSCLNDLVDKEINVNQNVIGSSHDYSLNKSVSKFSVVGKICSSLNKYANKSSKRKRKPTCDSSKKKPNCDSQDNYNVEGKESSNIGSKEHINNGRKRYANNGSNEYANSDSNEYANNGSNQYSNNSSKSYGSNKYSNNVVKRYANNGSNEYSNNSSKCYASNGSNEYSNNSSKCYGSNEYSNNGSKRYANKGSKRYANKGSKRYASNGSNESANDGSNECDRGNIYPDIGSMVFPNINSQNKAVIGSSEHATVGHMGYPGSEEIKMSYMNMLDVMQQKTFQHWAAWQQHLLKSYQFPIPTNEALNLSLLNTHPVNGHCYGADPGIGAHCASSIIKHNKKRRNKESGLESQNVRSFMKQNAYKSIRKSDTSLKCKAAALVSFNSDAFTEQSGCLDDVLPSEALDLTVSSQNLHKKVVCPPNVISSTVRSDKKMISCDEHSLSTYSHLKESSPVILDAPTGDSANHVVIQRSQTDLQRDEHSVRITGKSLNKYSISVARKRTKHINKEFMAVDFAASVVKYEEDPKEAIDVAVVKHEDRKVKTNKEQKDSLNLLEASATSRADNNQEASDGEICRDAGILHSELTATLTCKDSPAGNDISVHTPLLKDTRGEGSRVLPTVPNGLESKVISDNGKSSLNSVLQNIKATVDYLSWARPGEAPVRSDEVTNQKNATTRYSSCLSNTNVIKASVAGLDLQSSSGPALPNTQVPNIRSTSGIIENGRQHTTLPNTQVPDSTPSQNTCSPSGIIENGRQHTTLPNTQVPDSTPSQDTRSTSGIIKNGRQHTTLPNTQVPESTSSQNTCSTSGIIENGRQHTTCFQKEFSLQTLRQHQDYINCGLFENKIKKGLGSHIGDRPQMSSVQDEMVPCSRDIHRQVEVYTAKESYSCVYCGKVLSGRYSLTNHLRLHTDRKPFRCVMCGKAFVYRRHLDNHKKHHHLADNTSSVTSEVPDKVKQNSLRVEGSKLGKGSFMDTASQKSVTDLVTEEYFHNEGIKHSTVEDLQLKSKNISDMNSFTSDVLQNYCAELAPSKFKAEIDESEAVQKSKVEINHLKSKLFEVPYDTSNCEIPDPGSNCGRNPQKYIDASVRKKSRIQAVPKKFITHESRGSSDMQLSSINGLNIKIKKFKGDAFPHIVPENTVVTSSSQGKPYRSSYHHSPEYDVDESVSAKRTGLLDSQNCQEKLKLCCIICEKEFETEELFDKHLANHAEHTQDSESSICRECGEVFDYKSELQTHMIMHDQESLS